MTLLDLLIIYLSLGAPFGAYQIVQGVKPNGVGGLFRAVTAFLLWPPYAVRLAFRYLGYLGSVTKNIAFDAETEPDAKLIERIESLLNQFSQSARRSHRVVARRAEQGLERYLELSLASLRTPTGSGQYYELLTVSGHPSPHSGTTCLNRRNRNVIALHLTVARGDLITELDDLSSGRQEAIEIVETIAGLLSDTELATAISARLNSPREKEHTRQQPWETLKPQHKTIYNGEALTTTTLD